MVSRKNIKYKIQQDAKRVPHYGIRKLSIGVASVLLGTVFYMQNGSVHADVNPTVSTGNDSVNVVDKTSGTSGSAGVASTSAGASSTNFGVGSVNSAGSIVSTGDATNSMVTSQTSGSPVEGATKQANNADLVASEPESATPASQVNVGTDNSTDNSVVDNSNAISSLPPASHHQVSADGGNPSNERLSANLSLSANQKLNANILSLLASKVALTGSNNAVNGGFDKATWGTLDVNAWKGSVQGDYFQLTDYTGDANHVIVPNEADFERAGISTSGKQVGVTSDLMKHIFKDKATAQDATVAFSKTDNKHVKAIGNDWSNTWNAQNTNRGANLSKFDGTNLDVSNVTNMRWMFNGSQISDLSPLANWDVSNVKDMSWMFYNNQISDLSPLANWDVSNVTNMYYMFDRNQISDLSPLANWTVAKVTNISHMFSNNQISDLSLLANWDVSNVTNMSDMFSWNKITDLSPLANWKVDQVTDMNYMFGYNQIDNLSPLANWDVAKVTDMNYMFYNNRISDLSPLANWKVDQVTDMNYMFGYNQISDLSPLANWTVAKVTNISYMFSNNQISDLSPLANWKVDNVTDMSGMFSDSQISDLSPLANWDVSNVTNMSYMFGWNKITDLSPLANWTVAKVTNMSRMFVSNVTIQTKNLQAKRIINFVYPAGYTGKKQDPVIQTVDVPQRVKVELITKDSKPSNNILDWVTKTETPVTPTLVYFQDYTVPEIKGLLEPDKSVIAGQQADITKPINVTVTYKLVESDTNDAFALDSKNGLYEHANVNDNGGYDTDFWGTLDVSKFTTVKNGDNLEITGYNGDASKVIIPNIADFEINGLDQGAKQVTISSSVMLSLAQNATRIGLSKTNNQKVVASDTNWSNAFGGMTIGSGMTANDGMGLFSPNLTVMDLHNLDTTNITNIRSMFNGGSNLKVVGDLSQWNTANVTDMSNMFSQASKLANIGDLSKWDVSKVTDMSNMFSQASKLANIGDLSKWDVSKVTDMRWMFYQASALTNVGDLDNWNTSKVTNMDAMFQEASSLTNIGNLSKWDVSNVTNMDAMFQQASSLTNIGDLDNWNTSKVTDMGSMFSFASALTNIGDLSKWDVSNVAIMIGMFYQASALKQLNISNWDLTKLMGTEYFQYFVNSDPNLVVIANNIKLPTWYQNELNNSNDFWNDHMAVITNNEALLKATGSVDNVTVDDASVKRPVFYDSKGSDDAVAVLKQANQVYSKQYQSEHPGDILTLATDVDQTDPIALANAKFVVKRTLSELDTNDAFALNPANDLHEHKNVNDNGGYDTDFWGTLDVSKFTTVKNGDNLEITGYTGDTSKVIIPNIADFWVNKLDQGAKQVTISSSIMHQLAKNATRIGLSKTNNQKVVAGDAIWQDAFGGQTNAPNTSSNAYGGMWVYNPNLTVMDLHNLDTANITDMGSMFNGGHNLNVVGDLSQWNVTNVTSMRAMFQLASSLTNIGDLDNWNTSKVTDMSYMFNKASSLTNIGDLSKWDTHNVTDMSHMFDSDSALSNLGDLSSWNTSKVTNMKAMFQSDSNLKNLGNLDLWQTGNVTDMSYMFNGMSALTNVGDLSNWDTSKVTNMSIMFQNDSKLENLGNLDLWQTGNVTDMSYMFNGMSSLTNVGDLSNWDTSKVTNMKVMFELVSNLKNLGNLDRWQTGNVTDMSYMFNGMSSLTNVGDLSLWDTSKVINMRAMFNMDGSLTNIGDLSHWDTHNVTDMSYMFDSDSALSSLGDLSNWNTSKVTNMKAMFELASNLKKLGNLDRWQTSNVTDMSFMFNQDGSLINIGDLSNWDTHNVTDMRYMFQADSNLKDLGNLGLWKTGKVTDMGFMFSHAGSLTNIGDLGNWDTHNVTDMGYMFNQAGLSTSLGDLSNWDVHNVKDTSFMFNYMPNAAQLSNNFSKWKMDNVTTVRSMFGSPEAQKRFNISNFNLANVSTDASKQAMTDFIGTPGSLVIANHVSFPAVDLKAQRTFGDHSVVLTDNQDLLSKTKDNAPVDTIKFVDSEGNLLASYQRPVFYQDTGVTNVTYDNALNVVKPIVDQNNQQFLQSQRLNGRSLLSLYQLQSLNENDPVKYANGTFVLRRRQAPIVVNYLDAATNQTISKPVTVNGKVGLAQDVDLTTGLPDGYQLFNGVLQTISLKPATVAGVNYDVLVKHRLAFISSNANYTTDSIIPGTKAKHFMTALGSVQLTSTVSRQIVIKDANGRVIKTVPQTITFVRNAVVDAVTGHVQYLNWSYDGQYVLRAYQPVARGGYQINAAPAIQVTPKSVLADVVLQYQAIPASQRVAFVTSDGTVLTTKDLPSNGDFSSLVPAGYRAVTTSSIISQRDIANARIYHVLVEPKATTYTNYDQLPSQVTEPLTKTITRTINITMPNGRVRRVVQHVYFVRTATVAANGKVTYSNWTGVGQTSFDRLFVPKRRGYRLVMTDKQGQTLIGVNQMVVDPMMNNVVINVKYVK